MSWDGYITELLKDGTLEQAAICGMNPPAVWAASPQLSNILPDEISQMSTNQGSYMICGKKFLKLIDVENVTNLKERGCEGAVNRCAAMGKAETCLIIGVGTATTVGSKVTLIVEKYTKYLRSVGV